MKGRGQISFFSITLGVIVISSLLAPNIYSQGFSSKIHRVKINKKQPLSPGNIIASCIVEEGGDIPNKRYTLIYTSFEDNIIKALVEKTVVRWGGWGWVEVTWFSPTTEERSCSISSYYSECIFTLIGEVKIKVKVIDNLGNLIAEKYTKTNQ